MTAQEKADLLAKAKSLFRNSFAANHYRNTEQLDHVREFTINPFLHSVNCTRRANE